MRQARGVRRWPGSSPWLGRLRSSGLTRLLAVGLAAVSLVLLGAVPALGATATPADGSTGPAQGGGHTPRTVVSLTFDDGDADQMAAAQVLHRYRLPATFYIITGAVGTPGYVTLPDLRQLAADGNEIGGHTVSHLRLTALSTAEARRQVCESRSILARWGYRAISFAYPGGASSPRTEAIVRGLRLHQRPRRRGTARTGLPRLRRRGEHPAAPSFAAPHGRGGGQLMDPARPPAHCHRGRGPRRLAAAGLPPRVRGEPLRRPGRARHDAGRVRALARPATAARHGGQDRGPGDRRSGAPQLRTPRRPRRTRSSTRRWSRSPPRGR